MSKYKYDQAQGAIRIVLGTLLCIFMASAALSSSTELVRDGSIQYLAVDGKPEYVIVQGDILIPIEYYADKVNYEPKFWSDNDYPHIVRYKWDSDLPEFRRQRMLQAFAIIEGIADILFVEYQGGWMVPYFVIHSTYPNDNTNDGPEGNYATVGEMINGQLSIYDWGVMGVILHELGHILGLKHEHERRDRDNYIFVQKNNICPDYDDQFDLEGAAVGPYDFGSLMHYGQDAFSICDCRNCPDHCVSGNCPGQEITISVLPPYADEWQSRIGQRVGYSHYDSLGLMLMYRNAAWVVVDRNRSGDDGTLHSPYQSIVDGYVKVPRNGTIWVTGSGTYSYAGIYNKPVTIRAPFGAVSMGR